MLFPLFDISAADSFYLGIVHQFCVSIKQVNDHRNKRECNCFKFSFIDTFISNDPKCYRTKNCANGFEM